MADEWSPEAYGETPGDGPEYGLVLPFIDQSESFCLGFETGVQYARMRYGREAAFEQTVHTENLGQLRAAAQRAGWEARFAPIDDTWSTMHARRL